MKPRWTVLFYSSLATLIGVAWLTRSFGLGYSFWLNVGLVGMILATGCAFYALIRGVRQKWPAAAVLILAAPMGIDMMKSLRYVPEMIRWVGLSPVLMVLGTLSTLVTAIAILAMKTPPIPHDPVAPARVVD